MTETEWVKLELDLRDFSPDAFVAPLPTGAREMTLPELVVFLVMD